MYADQLDVFRCPNHSIMAAQRSQTSRFSIGFFGENSEQSNNLRKSLLENTVHIAWKLCLVTGAKQQNIVNKSSYL